MKMKAATALHIVGIRTDAAPPVLVVAVEDVEVVEELEEDDEFEVDEVLVVEMTPLLMPRIKVPPW